MYAPLVLPISFHLFEHLEKKCVKRISTVETPFYPQSNGGTNPNDCIDPIRLPPRFASNPILISFSILTRYIIDDNGHS